MNSEKVRQIVSDALDVASAQRDAFVRRACAGDEGMLAEVRSLLDAALNASEDGFFARVTLAENPNLQAGTMAAGDAQQIEVAAIGEKPGDFVGPYKLLQQIGEGGFGVVFMAAQERPVKRRVALKVIKAGMDTRAVIARFEAERQALAMMDHPNIARVLEAGATETGRPYFVMELVKGIPITDYCDQASLSMRQRLTLFIDVCRAVQHAHQKGIIHRDLKPSNVMVTLHDAQPVVKVIDFGISKAMDQKLTEKTLFTNYGQMIGTPAYMSPEQAVMSGLDVDTRSDVYSLGVLLYELLVGSPPFDARTLRSAGFEGMRRIIREQQPTKPSSKANTLSPELKLTVATRRQLNSQVLSRQLRGDLDWIVLKAIEKDRNRRYESPSALVQDIERHLNSQPVTAGAPGTAYRVRKFLRRNRAPVAVGVVIVTLLLSGTAVSLWQAFRATRAEHVAESAQLNANAVRDFLENKLLAQADTGAQADALLLAGESSSEAVLNPTIRELLDRAVKELAPDKIEQNFPNQPLTQGEILQTIGLAFTGVGEYPIAIDTLKRSVATFSQLLGPDHPQTLNAMNNLAAAYQQAGMLDQSLPLLERTLRLQKLKFGADHPDTFNTRNNLAVAYKDTGDVGKAVSLFEETLKLMRDKRGPQHPDTLNTADNLAQAYMAAGRVKSALQLLDDTLKLRTASQGPEHPRTLSTKNSLALAYEQSGNMDTAVPLFEDTVRQMTEKLGADHPFTLNAMSNLACAYQIVGKYDSAEQLFEKTLERMKQKLPPDHPRTIDTMNNLAVTYQRAGQPQRAVDLFERTLKLSQAKFGPDHPSTLRTMSNLAVAYEAEGRLDLALPQFEKTLELQRTKLGADHPDTIVTADSLLAVYDEAKEFEKAEPLYQERLSQVKKASGAESPEYASELSGLARNLLREKKWSESEPYLHQSLSIREKILPDDWRTFSTQSLLGGSLLGQMKYSDAEPLLLSGYQGMKLRGQLMPPQAIGRLTEALDRLIELYTVTNNAVELKKWQAERAKYAASAPSK